MEILWNLLQFVVVVGVMGLVAHFLLARYAKASHDKIDAKFKELVEEIRSLTGK